MVSGIESHLKFLQIVTYWGNLEREGIVEACKIEDNILDESHLCGLGIERYMNIVLLIDN